jgi:hypothetical protein
MSRFVAGYLCGAQTGWPAELYRAASGRFNDIFGGRPVSGQRASRQAPYVQVSPEPEPDCPGVTLTSQSVFRLNQQVRRV